MDYMDILYTSMKSALLRTGHTFGPIPTIIGAAEYYRWLKYMPEEMKKRIDEINKKTDDELSLAELKEKKDFIEGEYILKQLEAYFCGNIVDCNYIELKKYIKTHSLKNLIVSKLTEEEIELAHKKYEELIKDNDVGYFDYFLGEKYILNYAPESMTDFYAMELYSIFVKKRTRSGISETMRDAYKKNAGASGKIRRFTI